MTSEGHNHFIRSNGKSSDLHIHFGSVVFVISVSMSSPQFAPSVLLWQWLISVDALPRAVIDHIIMHQLQLVHSEDTVTNQSSAVHSKDLVAVQFSLQWVHQVLCSERQSNPKAGSQCHILIKSSSRPTVVEIQSVEGSEVPQSFSQCRCECSSVSEQCLQ